MTEIHKELYHLLFAKYGKALLSKKETAEVVGFSVPTLDRMRSQGIGPEYKKMPSKSDTGTVKYPLYEIVRFIVEHNMKTA